MDQLICAYPSHTTYWYKVGVLKVPAIYSMGTSVHMFIRQHKRDAAGSSAGVNDRAGSSSRQLGRSKPSAS